MSPQLEPLPPPRTRDDDALAFLKSHGLTANVCTIGSSDWDASRDPFQYFLKYTLGLVKAIFYSKVLSRGSWFHLRLRLFLEGHPNPNRAMMDLLKAREAEIKSVGPQSGLQGSYLESVLHHTRKDCLTIETWWEALQGIRITDHTGKTESIVEFLSRDYWQVLGSEIVLVHVDPRWPSTPLRSTLDGLLYHKGQNRLYIIEAKTFDGNPIVRLETASFEFQTRHFANSLQHFLDTGTLQKHFDLPADVKFGGIIHICVQKPTINFGQKDRDYSLDTTPFKSGPRMGQPRNTRNYSGEPNLSNYVTRCLDWYLARGEYQDKTEERQLAPPVNRNTTLSTELLDTDAIAEYSRQVDEIVRLATAKPVPASFPRTTICRQYGTLSAYAPFYTRPIAEWPTIIQADGFVQRWRDLPYQDISESPPIAVAPIGIS